MPQVLESFDFKTRARKEEYPWEQLLDGGIYHMLPGTDYESKNNTLGQLAYKTARKYGKTIHVRPFNAKDPTQGIVLQAAPASDEQLAKWAQQDAARLEKKHQQNNGSTEGRTEVSAEESFDQSPDAPTATAIATKKASAKKK